jgi:hypothetical protein
MRVSLLPPEALQATLCRMESWDDAGRGGWGTGRRGQRGREEHTLTGVEELKRALRERAEIVAERERELVHLRAQLARRLEETEKRRGDKRGAELAEREHKLAEREQELEKALAAAAQREREAASELALAQAERDRLEERERAAHEVERELAGLRVRLERERSALGISVPEPESPSQPAQAPEPEQLPPPTPLPPPPEEPELDPAAAEPANPQAHTHRR